MSIKIQNLVKIYGSQRAVDDISFEVKPGQILGFLGPNGAGKSTTMKIITGYIPQTSGKVEVCDFDVSSSSMEVRRQIGYLPEHNPLYLDMYVKEYLAFIAGIHRLGAKTKAAVQEIIERTGLEKEYKKQIWALSKGYRQRVGLAQAMIHNPKVLILDEPTSGLDPNQVSEIRNLVKEIGRDRTVVLSTHIMQEVKAMCSRVVIINKGKIVANDSTEHLQQTMKEEIRFLLEVKGESHAGIWQAIKGVLQVENLGHGKYRVTAESDIREDLFRQAVDNKLVLLSVSQEENSLEDVFRQLTTKPQS